MSVKIPVVRPDLGDAEVAAAERVIRSGWVTQGPEVAAFEADFASAVGADHAVAVSSATAALELSLRCLGVGPGDDVVTASHSFIATANAISAVGARPVFCDVESDTLGLDPARLAETITPRTRAVLPVHQLGIPCDIEAILKIAAERDLPVVEDAACAVGSEIRVGDDWQRVGRPHGALCCFSFHPRKVVTTGDGGMITTNTTAFDSQLRSLRQHAMSVPDTVRHASDTVVFEEYTEPAYNCRMTDIQAAVGRPQLARLDDIVAERRRLAQRYLEALTDNRCLALPVERPGARCNWQSFPLFVRDDSPLDQRQVLQALMDAGIGAKRGVHNAHQEPAYSGRGNWAAGPGGLAVSEKLRDTTVALPLFHGMTDAEQDQVIEAVQAL